MQRFIIEFKMNKLLIIQCFFFILCLEIITEAQIAETKTGLVQGTNLTSRNGRTFSAFLGIPYAKPPIGNLRFQAPEPSAPWTGIRDGTSYGPVCYQVYPNGYEPPTETPPNNATGAEDCLTVNVFSHKNFTNGSEEELLPVMVFIHGGWFMALHSNYFGPRYLMDHDMILVTFNYRLSAFGFLSTEDENAPGNAGIIDQVLALKWVQDNIRSFGGNASRVTIYGESAGAAAVQYHLLSPQSQGLFSAAISGSGTAFKVYSHQDNPLQAAQKLASEVGCGDFIGNNTAMVSCLQSVDGSEIAKRGNEYLAALKDPLRMFSPSTEILGTAPNPFLTRHPYEILSEEGQQRVPWMVGINSGEGFTATLNIRRDEEWVRKVNSDWVNLAHQFLVYNETYTNWTEAISDFYLDSFRTNGTIDFEKDFMGFTNLFSDRFYIHASLHAAKLQAGYSPVFVYYYDYMLETNPVGLGALHGEEMAIVFSPRNFTDPGIEEGHPDYEESRLIVDLWAQFITDPYNVRHEGRLWESVNPLDSNPNMNCFIFKNADRGQQGVSSVPESVTNRVNFWSDNHIPPYREYKS